MSLISVAREALMSLPIADIVRERLALALDRAAEAEAEIAVLKAQNAALKAALERERLDHQQAKDELRRLQKEHEEETRILAGVEFRRGRRTGGQWMPFCPACQLPADTNQAIVKCGHATCGWKAMLYTHKLPGLIATL